MTERVNSATFREDKSGRNLALGWMTFMPLLSRQDYLRVCRYCMADYLMYIAILVK